MLLLSACGGTGGGQVTVPSEPSGTLQVSGVELRTSLAGTSRPSVRVQGVLLDGCTSLGPISQRREGRTIIVSIPTIHTGASVCTQVAQLVDLTIPLEGDFPPGEYVVRVNGVERRFRI
jgi:hypothetical protein